MLSLSGGRIWNLYSLSLFIQLQNSVCSDELNLNVLLLLDSSGVIFLDCVYFVHSRWLEFRHFNMLLLQQGKECLFLRRMT